MCRVVQSSCARVSRRVRVERGLSDYFVKILFLDDDGVPTKRYIERVAAANYDVCEGIPTPRTGYGRFLSHMDDLRTINCLYSARSSRHSGIRSTYTAKACA